MSVIKVISNLRNYEANIGPVQEYLAHLVDLPNKTFIVDENVWRCYSDGLLSILPRPETFTFPALEERKTLEGVQQVYDQLMDRSAKRNLTLITIGGGILQDVTGFVASTLYRGINWVLIPTTLLAQADSCIGSKTSLNYKKFKNLIGSFYPPTEVWIDPSFLGTLETQDFYSGLGEVVKLHIMGGEGKTQQLLNSFAAISARDSTTLEIAIRTSLEIKLDFIANDEFDLGRRNMLNYGHCFGHALESVTNFRIPHGQAVVIGMVLANDIANRRGLLSEGKRKFLQEKLLAPSLKTKLQSGDFQPEPLIEAMGKDKKRTGKGLVLIMYTESGEMVRVDNLEASEVQDILQTASKDLL